MPIIYLSPSTQENNYYVTGTGTEEDWMNRLADAMIPYLNSSGIRYTRNTPTPPVRAITATSAASSLSTIPPAPRDSGQHRFLSTTSGKFTRSLTWS